MYCHNTCVTVAVYIFRIVLSVPIHWWLLPVKSHKWRPNRQCLISSLNLNRYHLYRIVISPQSKILVNAWFHFESGPKPQFIWIQKSNISSRSVRLMMRLSPIQNQSTRQVRVLMQVTMNSQTLMMMKRRDLMKKTRLTQLYHGLQDQIHPGRQEIQSDIWLDAVSILSELKTVDMPILGSICCFSVWLAKCSL